MHIPEAAPLLIKISDTDVEYLRPLQRKSPCKAATERASQLKRLFLLLLPYLAIVAILTAIIFLGGTFGHRIESRNLKMIARSWDPSKPRWYQLTRIASGTEVDEDGSFRNLTYPDCVSFDVRPWREVQATELPWLQEFEKNRTGRIFHREVHAMILPSQDVATVLCPPSTFLGPGHPVDFNG